MKRLWSILRGHETVQTQADDDADIQRRAIDMKLCAMERGAERMQTEAKRTKDAAAETERAAQALLKRLAEDFPR